MSVCSARILTGSPTRLDPSLPPLPAPRAVRSSGSPPARTDRAFLPSPPQSPQRTVVIEDDTHTAHSLTTVGGAPRRDCASTRTVMQCGHTLRTQHLKSHRQAESKLDFSEAFLEHSHPHPHPKKRNRFVVSLSTCSFLQVLRLEHEICRFHLFRKD